jgi:hypothetical protein
VHGGKIIGKNIKIKTKYLVSNIIFYFIDFVLLLKWRSCIRYLAKFGVIQNINVKKYQAPFHVVGVVLAIFGE